MASQTSGLVYNFIYAMVFGLYTALSKKLVLLKNNGTAMTI
jgi:hypothetical protein